MGVDRRRVCGGFRGLRVAHMGSVVVAVHIARLRALAVTPVSCKQVGASHGPGILPPYAIGSGLHARGA